MPPGDYALRHGRSVAFAGSEMRKHLEEALAEAVAIAERAEFTLLLEPLNTLVDHPGYYLDSSREAVEIVARPWPALGCEVLYDIYHMQIMEGNLLATIEKNLALDRPLPCRGRARPGRAVRLGTELSGHSGEDRVARL